MSQYFIFYTESSIVCLIIFSIILLHDLSRIDRQEKQIKFDYALVAFMLYFISDAFWAALISGIIPKTLTSVKGVNYFNNIFMALITYTWFRYVLAVEKVEKRNRPIQRFAMAFPLIISVVLSAFLYFVKPETMINESLGTTTASTAMLIAVPIIYIAAILIYTLRKAAAAKTPAERRIHLRLGCLPLAIVFGGLLQVVLLDFVPIFCYCCAIVMIIFYIQSIESQVSIDPLTGLNNRGQMQRYTQQESNLHRDGLRTFVGMIDVNDFKNINDVYGHAEGDHALTMIADSLRHAAGKIGFPVFIARYGGDEFVVIMHCKDETGPDAMGREIRRQIQKESAEAGIPYKITIAYGFDELSKYGESFESCLRRADEKSYRDKDYQKRLAS